MVLYKVIPITKLEEKEIDTNNPLRAVKELFTGIKFKVENIETSASWNVELFEIKVTYVG